MWENADGLFDVDRRYVVVVVVVVAVVLAFLDYYELMAIISPVVTKRRNKESKRT